MFQDRYPLAADPGFADIRTEYMLTNLFGSTSNWSLHLRLTAWLAMIKPLLLLIDCVAHMFVVAIPATVSVDFSMK